MALSCTALPSNVTKLVFIRISMMIDHNKEEEASEDEDDSDNFDEGHVDVFRIGSPSIC